jgi:hypothetical protein
MESIGAVSMTKWLASLILTLMILSASSASADILEIEPNGTFATRQFVPDGTSSVLGSLEVQYDFSAADALDVGVVNDHTFSAAAGTEFFAWIDNGVTDEYPDTVMGAFNSAGFLVGYNDDDFRFGDERHPPGIR